MTFEENLKFKRDIPLTAYIDFETTAPTDDYLDPESKKMNAVSYVIIFAFHPNLDLKRVIIERSFGYSLEKLTTIDYLTTEQLKYKDLTTLKQLRDCAISVATKKNKIAISEMFSTELKFASDCLINWFNLKFKKMKKEELLKLKNQSIGKMIIAKFVIFPFTLILQTFDVEKEKMPYGDFIIKKVHKFLRNIFSEEELMSSPAIKNLQSFHENFSTFLQVVVYLQNSINSIKDFSECFYDELLEFCNEFCDDCTDFIEIKEKISDVEVKSKQTTKIPKFTLQIYAFVYQRIARFPKTKFEIKTVTTGNLFEFVHKIINVKINLHHSHITGKIIGYVHDFCNLQVRENKDVIPCIAHNFFNFDMIFYLSQLDFLFGEQKTFILVEKISPT